MRGLRESEKRNQEIGNSRESNVRESSGTADSEYPSLVFTQIITRSWIARIGACFERHEGGTGHLNTHANAFTLIFHRGQLPSATHQVGIVVGFWWATAPGAQAWLLSALSEQPAEFRSFLFQKN